MDKGILLWVGFLALFAIGFILSKVIKKQTDEEGIETTGVISRITDEGNAEEIDIHVYARYETNDGKEVEGILMNAPSDLRPGQKVLIKYHPALKANAKLIRIMED